MKNTIPLLVMFIVIFLRSPAHSLDANAIARQLYPHNVEDQRFVSHFFSIVDSHKINDPLFEGAGPSISGFSLDKINFAFMTNETAETVDLVFFNWTQSVFKNLNKDVLLSKLYGKNVYVLRSVSKNTIGSQGKDHSQLTNFSYILGSNYIEAQLKLNNTDMNIPEPWLNWKPHKRYMERTHPLRKALNTHNLTLLSPSKKLYLQQMGIEESLFDLAEKELFKHDEKGYWNLIMGMMIHEMFHVKEGEDTVNKKSLQRNIDENRDELVSQLKNNQELGQLYSTYAQIVFSIGESLTQVEPTTNDSIQLSDLKVVITTLKKKYPNAWSFIWNYEYTEGFAEYVSAYSMVSSGVTTLAKQINLQKSDINNFAYRTGAIGGLYLATRVKKLSFQGNRDHSSSLWEVVLSDSEAIDSTASLSDIIQKYNNEPFDSKAEIESIIEYLESTVDH